MIIHSREAAADTLRVMKEEKSEEIGGVIHCFSHSVEMAEEYLKMGFYLGIGGVVTFKNAKKIKEVVQMAPMGAHSAGNRQSVSGTGSVPGKTKFISVSAVRCAGDRRTQGNFRRRSHGDNREKCGQTVSSRGIGSDTRGVSSVLFVRINSVWPDKLNRRKRKWLIKQ